MIAPGIPTKCAYFANHNQAIGQAYLGKWRSLCGLFCSIYNDKAKKEIGFKDFQDI
jgi:hypothetical protein